jgi:hypothetical protein
MHTGKTWSHEDVQLTNQFAFTIAEKITSDIPDPLTIAEAQSRSDWLQWDATINSELDSLIRRQVFVQ